MRILIASKFFYPRGGAEMVAIDTRRLLLARGHDVRVHAMQFAANEPLAERDEWPSEVSFRGTIADSLRGVSRIMGRGDARRCARQALHRFRPDVVHLHNVHSYLSPALAEEAHAEGIRTVWTVHDPKLVCPAGTLRSASGEYCEACVEGVGARVLRRRCSHESAAWSAAAWLEAMVWNRHRLAAATDVFVVPSNYLANLMIRAGFPPEKIKVIGNPLRADMAEAIEADATSFSDSYYLYAGRLAPEKGVQTLLEAATRAGVKVIVAGCGPQEESLRRRYAGNAAIEFVGSVGAPALVKLLRGARATVMPSEWGENYPLMAIESLCCGTPVIGSRIGGIPEIVGSDCGALFAAGDTNTLAQLLGSFAPMAPEKRMKLAEESIKRCSSTPYIDALMDVYRKEGSL